MAVEPEQAAVGHNSPMRSLQQPPSLLQSLKSKRMNCKKGNPLKEGSVFLTFPFCTLRKIEISVLVLFALF
jgi:hypothetical protein